MSLTNPNICYELKIQVLEKEKEFFSMLLTELGITEFMYGQIDCDLDAEYDPSKTNLDLYEKMNPNTPIIMYSEDKEYLESVQIALQNILPKTALTITDNMFTLQEISDQNWRESWKQSFKPGHSERNFAILPLGKNPTYFQKNLKIVINPGMAFGTGQHETTRLCLEMMINYPAPKRFFDVGTGSGILAIAAHLLGARYIVGNDIDPDCMDIAYDNAKNNGICSIIFTQDSLNKIEEKNFDMIVANIQSKPLKTLVPDILKKISKEGLVILSGILTSEKEEFIEFLNKNHAKIVETRDYNHWCVLVCKIN